MTAVGGARGRAPVMALSAAPTPPRVLLRGLWDSRELLATLASRDFFVRYRRAAFGVGWSVLLPAVQAGVLAVVLGRVTDIEVEHYPVYILSGIVAWTYFLTTVTAGSTSIVDGSSLASRIYFPRAVLPLAVCGSNAFGLAIGVAVLTVAVVVTGAWPGLAVLWLVPGVLLLLAVTAGFTLVLSAAHVFFRDTKYAVQAAAFAWFYVTPVFYPLDLLRGWLRVLVEANPATGPVELFHAAALGRPVSGAAVAWSAGWAVVLLAVALVVHCRRDRLFTDLL